MLRALPFTTFGEAAALGLEAVTIIENLQAHPGQPFDGPLA
jgi:hypothetical protein